MFDLKFNHGILFCLLMMMTKKQKQKEKKTLRKKAVKNQQTFLVS